MPDQPPTCALCQHYARYGTTHTVSVGDCPETRRQVVGDMAACEKFEEKQKEQHT